MKRSGAIALDIAFPLAGSDTHTGRVRRRQRRYSTRYTLHSVSFLLLVLCSGCATEGVGIGSVTFVNEGLAKYGTLPGPHESEIETADGADRSPVSGLIAVGAVSNFREFENENLDDLYSRYVASFEVWGSGRDPVVTRSDFSLDYAGWTRLMIRRAMLGTASWYVTTLVTSELASGIKFEHPFRVSVDQSTGDLVAATTNVDGAFVVDAVLCRDDENYTDCAAQYESGVFDARTGMELENNLDAKQGGTQIDTVTFLPVR